MIPPRGAFALILGGAADGRVDAAKLRDRLKLVARLARSEKSSQSAAASAEAQLMSVVRPAVRPESRAPELIVMADAAKQGAMATPTLSVKNSLRGKQILLIGVAGFIGKVWLAQLLMQIPEIGEFIC